MAENDNDIELSVGIKLDESQFTNAYDRILNQVASKTNAVLNEEIGKMTGSAAGWGKLPFYNMHDAKVGNKYATQAFIASLAEDLKSQGMDTHKSNLEYQGALMNAAYRSSVPDPMDRYHILASQGFIKQADATHPDTALSRAIETDYNLLQQSWARDFVRTKGSGENKRSYVDFDSMRKYAVEAGLGHWIDPLKEETADNFELFGEDNQFEAINGELEKIEDKSDKSSKAFKDWNDTLKGVLGTLTAIGSLTALGKVFETAYVGAEKGSTQAATSLPRTRAFVGMGALDVLATQVAGQSVGLGKDAIYNEIVDLSNRREEYKLLGQGLDALFPSLSGIFDNIMSGDNPYDAYKGILTELYDALQGADDDTRAQALMLLDKQGLGGASYIIGSFLSNPKLAEEMDYDPTKLFSLKENPYRSSYSGGEAILPDLTQLNESIAASYSQMYLDWEVAFGKPFKTWWNNTLISTVVPWFEKMLNYVSPEEKKKRKEDSAYVMGTVTIDTSGTPKEAMRNDTVISDMLVRTAATTTLTGNKDNWKDVRDTNYIAPTKIKELFTKGGWKDTKAITDYDQGDNPKAWFNALKKLTSSKAYKTDLSDEDAIAADSLMSRAYKALDFLDVTGLGGRLTDLDFDQSDTAVIRLLQKYLQSGDENLLDTFLYNTYSNTADFRAIKDFVEKNSSYLKEHERERLDINVTLFDEYGRKLQSEVQSIINR